MRKVLAHYSVWKALGPLMVAFAVGIGVPYFTIWFDGGHVLKFAETPQMRYQLPLLLIAWGGAAIALAASAMLFNKLLFGDSAALWIEQGRLIFFHRWALSVRCEDVESISYGDADVTQRKRIVVRTRRGNDMKVPTGALKETPELVFSRLKEEFS